MPLIAAWRWREDIFRDDGDREMLLATLAETVEKTGLQVHAQGTRRLVFFRSLLFSVEIGRAHV